jgi:molecular chaperone HscB
MDFSSNHFELFGLPARFAVDRPTLDRAFRELQGEVHPDKFAHAGDAEQRVAMQWATQANEAYVTLKNPLKRARYLLELAGVDVAVETNTAMPPDFLIEQMEWREAVDEARKGGALHELEHLLQRLRGQLDERYAALGHMLDADLAGNAQAAAAEVRKLMFLEKLMQDIDEAIAEVEDAL